MAKPKVKRKRTSKIISKIFNTNDVVVWSEHDGRYNFRDRIVRIVQRKADCTQYLVEDINRNWALVSVNELQEIAWDKEQSG